MSERRTDSTGPARGQTPDQWVADCWSDMRRRWRQRDFVRVEDYLPADYQTALPQDALIDLVYGEYILCKEYEIPIEQRDYAQRFPHLESALQRQFALDDALSSEIPLEFESTLTGSSDDATLDTEPVPERIGKYIVVTRIGIGGQAEVYRAVHPTLGKEVVLKLARPARGGGPAARKRLESEAEILARVEHPNLARIFDLDFHDDRPFLVMEFIRGRTLEQFAHQENPSPSASAALLAKIARGVAAAHRCGTAHLDIKPSNVLVDDDGEPRLIDFGLAHLADAWHEEVLEQNSLRGTLHFMAPEQANGLGSEIDYRADIFALGGLLFFLLTGEPPYPRGTRFAELLERVQRCDWDQDQLYRRRIPPRMRSCCLQAMDRQPERRFAGAEALAKELKNCAGHDFRWPRLVALAAVLTLVLAGVVAGRSWFRDGQDRRAPPAISTGDERPASETAAPFETELAVQIWDEDRFLDLPNVAPARSGDHLRITARIPAGMHYSLFSLTSEGKLEEIELGSTGGQPADICYPESGKAVPLAGPPGTELILVCGRASKPLSTDELQSLWQRSDRLPQLPDLSILRVNQRGVSVEQRGRGLGSPVDLLDPEAVVRGRLEFLHKVLQQNTDFFDAVVFSHR